MKKRMLAYTLAILICLSLAPTLAGAAAAPTMQDAKAAVAYTTETATAPTAASIPAGTTSATDAAQKLHALGLFGGVGNNADGTPNFDLDRAPTRVEAITLFVRLLGKEAEALRGTWTTPFTDVVDWAKPYVGYAYAYGLANGVGATTFGGSSPTTVAQYLTFVLRALGYESGTDFEWDRSWVLSDNLGFTVGQYNAATTKFTRGDAAAVSFDALSAKFKNSDKQLYQSLMEAGVFSEAAAKNVGLYPSNMPTSITLAYEDVTVQVGKTAALDATVLPDDAENKTITWTSSNTSIASVSSTGVVTGVAIGTATITAKTANNISATCIVRVTEASPFDQPVLNKEYGPLTIIDEVSSRTTYTNTVSSLVFTSYKKYDFATYYYINVSIQGVTDDKYCDIAVYFYDANGRVLAQEGILKSVTPNVPYNIIVDTFSVEGDVLKNAVRIGFFSRSGREANTGGGSAGGGNTGGDNGGTTQTAPAYSVPVLNSEYGPFTINNYYSTGNFWGSTSVTSFVFTKCEKAFESSKYKLTFSVQGTASGDNNNFYIYFYDSGNRVLEKLYVNLNVAKNQSFNTVKETYINDNASIENAVRLAFYSYSGEAANSTGGGSSGGGSTGGGSTGGGGTGGGSTGGGSTGGGSTGGGSTGPSPVDKYETYYGYSGIPSFDQFTNSGGLLNSVKANMETYFYGSATLDEIDTYVAVLEECGFDKSSMLNAYIFTKGTVGDSAYREVRLSYAATPGGGGKYALNVAIARIYPTNQQ
ncbi:MAG: Ig-like domain-containing protein [Oscillospiraceae bacterium]|nr:Ig-like domain-containing protein [Oscillospiraceae bacterium]